MMSRGTLLDTLAPLKYHGPMADSLFVFLLGGSGAAMEDKEDGRLRGQADLFLYVFLMLPQQFRMQPDIPGLIHAVHIAETGGNREIGADR
jgi:hypothetical protein